MGAAEDDLRIGTRFPCQVGHPVGAFDLGREHVGDTDDVGGRSPKPGPDLGVAVTKDTVATAVNPGLGGKPGVVDVDLDVGQALA